MDIEMAMSFSEYLQMRSKKKEMEGRGERAQLIIECEKRKGQNYWQNNNNRM